MRMYKLGSIWVDLDQIKAISQVYVDPLRDTNPHYVALFSYGGPIRVHFSETNEVLIKYEVRRLLCAWSGMPPDAIPLESIQIQDI